VSRLFDLGIEPFLVASALIGILAQRLVQRNCPYCAVPHPPSAEALNKIGGLEQLPPDAKWLAGRGCEKCMQVGFKGRLAIHELLQVNDELRALITARAPEHELRRAARAAGMRTLIEDAVAKAAQGLTTLEAILQVVSPDDAAVPAGGAAPASDPVVALREKEPERETGSTVASAKTVVEERAGEKQRVLIVEDNRTITSVVKYFLELEGFEVLLAEDGLIGLKTAQQERPDVIVTDVNMPGMDGIAMVKALRADPATSHIAILMLTSEDSLDSETRGLSAGADDYILKPVEPRRLAARVKALLARSRGRQFAGAK
jgi:CheY-like chemotaxis protein